MSTLEERNAIYDQAKALVLQGWCQGDYAKNDYNVSVNWIGDYYEHRNFCGIGALLNRLPLSSLYERDLYLEPLREVLMPMGFKTFSEYNDVPRRTKYEVAAIFDQAKEMPLVAG